MRHPERRPAGERISRRDLFHMAGATGAGLALGAGGYATLRGALDARNTGDEAAGMPGLKRVAFNGPHQAGIDTPQH